MKLRLKKHIEYMQNEWSKAVPDKNKLRRRMMLTFPGRRRLMNSQISLVEIRSEFPALFCFEEVSLDKTYTLLLITVPTLKYSTLWQNIQLNELIKCSTAYNSNCWYYRFLQNSSDYWE